MPFKGLADLRTAPAEVLVIFPGRGRLQSHTSTPTRLRRAFYSHCLFLVTHGPTSPWTLSLDCPVPMEIQSYSPSWTDLARWLISSLFRNCCRPRRWLSCWCSISSASLDSPYVDVAFGLWTFIHAQIVKLRGRTKTLRSPSSAWPLRILLRDLLS